MAFARRKYCEFYDYFYNKWTVEFWDESGVAETIFTAGAEPLSFRFGPSGDLHTVIKSTECTVNLVEKQGEDYDWLITDDDRKIKVIVTTGESTTSSTSLAIGTGTKNLTVGTGLGYVATQAIKITLAGVPGGLGLLYSMTGTIDSYNSGTGALQVNVTSVTGIGTFNNWTVYLIGASITTRFVGWVIPNEYIDDIGYIKQITVRASDQLSLLSSKLYTVNGLNVPSDSGGNKYTGWDTIINQVFNILDKTDLDLDVCVACNLYESVSMNVTATDDPFNQAEVNQARWISDDNVPMDCVTVLEELLKPFWCRIFQADGYWWIMRVRDMMESSIAYRVYNSTTRAITSNATLSHRKITTTSLQKFTPYVQRIGGELSFKPGWKQNTIEVDYGLKKSIVVDLILDNMSMVSSLNEDWTNAGTKFGLTTWTPTTVWANTGARHTLDLSLYLASPLTDIFTSSHYTFSLACGRSDRAALTNPSCEIRLVLFVSGVQEYWYNDDTEAWEAVGVSLSKVPFKYTSDPKNSLEIQSIMVEPPPVDGQLKIYFFAPYKTFDALVEFYIRDVAFTIYADPDTEITNGKVYYGMYNVNNVFMPEPLRILLSDGSIADSDLYNGGILINSVSPAVPSATWTQIGSADPTIGSLIDWLNWNAWEQHSILSKELESSFIGLLNFYTVLQLTEFSDTRFIMNDVEYFVRSSIWSGNFLESKAFLSDFSSFVGELILKSNALPNADGSYTTIIMQSGVATNPGGNTYELQLNDNGEFAGSTGVTFDPVSGRLLKGGVLPLIEYRRQTETSGAGETQVIFDESFESGDVFSLEPVIWGVGVDGNAVPGFPYDIDQDGFKINFGEVVTFLVTAMIER